MKKNVFRTVFMGMGIGLSIFALTGIIFNILYQGDFVLHNWSYTKMAVGSMYKRLREKSFIMQLLRKRLL